MSNKFSGCKETRAVARRVSGPGRTLRAGSTASERWQARARFSDLEVPVNDASRVEVGKGARNAPKSGPGLSLRVRALVNEALEELAAVHKLQDEGDFFRRFIAAVVANDARMGPHGLHHGKLALD